MRIILTSIVWLLCTSQYTFADIDPWGFDDVQEVEEKSKSEESKIQSPFIPDFMEDGTDRGSSRPEGRSASPSAQARAEIPGKDQNTSVHSFESYRTYRFTYMPDLDENLRYALLAFLLLLGYCAPLIFYPGMLRSPHARPGSSAAKAILLGGTFSSLIALPLMARDIPQAGGDSLIPFYLQFLNYIYVAMILSVLIIFAFLSSQSKPTR